MGYNAQCIQANPIRVPAANLPALRDQLRRHTEQRTATGVAGDADPADADADAYAYADYGFEVERHHDGGGGFDAIGWDGPTLGDDFEATCQMLATHPAPEPALRAMAGQDATTWAITFDAGHATESHAHITTHPHGAASHQATAHELRALADAMGPTDTITVTVPPGPLTQSITRHRPGPEAT